MGIADYYKRKKIRFLIKIGILLALLYPIAITAFALLYIKISLIFSPLNLVSVSLKPTVPGYFSSNWQLTLKESELIEDDIQTLVYDLKIYHGPVISQQAFGENKWFFQRIFTFWKRCFPLYFEVTPANELAQYLDKKGAKLSLSLNWRGRLETEFIHPYWRSQNTQNLLAFYNKNELVFDFPTTYNQSLAHQMTVNFDEKWSLLGHKNVTLLVGLDKLELPFHTERVDNASLTFRYQASEPRSQITMIARGLIDNKTVFDCDLVIGDFFTKNFFESYQFNSEEILSLLLVKESPVWSGLLNSDPLNAFLDKLDPRYLSFNANFITGEKKEYIDLDYSTLSGFQLRGDAEQLLAQELYVLLAHLS